jgi:CheY-like chemotaxis protein
VAASSHSFVRSDPMTPTTFSRSGPEIHRTSSLGLGDGADIGRRIPEANCEIAPNELGVGLTSRWSSHAFAIRLGPIVKGDSESQKQQRDSSNGQAETTMGEEHSATKACSTRRVLIVDDEPIVLSVLQDFFGSFQHGHVYEITTAESAAGAFEILRRKQFDLILLDVVIPATAGYWLSESDLGFGLLARLRDLGVTTPVLVMTGRSSAAKEAKALNAGAAGFLDKPVGLHDLDNAVTRAIGSASGGVSPVTAYATRIRRYSGPTPTSKAGEYRIWLSDQPSEDFRRSFQKLAQAKAAKPLRLSLEKNATAFTFVSSGDLKTDLQTIDLLLKDATR